MSQGNMDALSWVLREPHEAAAEIEQLRAENERLRARLERWERVAGGAYPNLMGDVGG